MYRKHRNQWTCFRQMKVNLEAFLTGSNAGMFTFFVRSTIKSCWKIIGRCLIAIARKESQETSKCGSINNEYSLVLLLMLCFVFLSHRVCRRKMKIQSSEKGNESITEKNNLWTYPIDVIILENDFNLVITDEERIFYYYYFTVCMTGRSLRSVYITELSVVIIISRMILSWSPLDDVLF